MKGTVVQLKENEIKEQKDYAAKYLALLQKEIAYGNLMDLDNINAYAKAYKVHSENVSNGYIIIGNHASE